MFETPPDAATSPPDQESENGDVVLPIDIFGEHADEHLAALRALEDAAGRLFAEQCAALLALWDSTPADCKVGRRPHVLAEAGTALGLHPLTVEARLSVAFTLQTHPLLDTLLRGGRLGIAHLLAADDEISAVGDKALADRMLHAALATEGRLGWTGTPSELRTALRRLAITLDPAAAARRRADQLATRTGLRLRPLPDGLAELVATGGAPQITAADHLLDILSRPDGPDDPRSRGQRQIDALLGALTARAGTGTGTGAALELQLEIPVHVTSSTPAAAGMLPEPVTIQTQLTPDLLAVLHQAGAASPSPATAAQPAPAPTEPTARRRVPRFGVPELLGSGPLDPAHLRELLTDPAGLPVGLSHLTVRRVCTDPTGQIIAADPRAIPLHRLTGKATDRSDRSDRSDLPGLPDLPGLLARLTTSLPPPPPRTDSYTPTADQTRVVRARDTMCQFPGCRRRASRTELDHRTPHPQGPTTVANLH